MPWTHLTPTLLVSTPSPRKSLMKSSSEPYLSHPLNPQPVRMGSQLESCSQCGLSPPVETSFVLGSVPSSWKYAIINPLPKPSSLDFRPISLLSHLGKITERLATWLLNDDTQLRPNQLRCQQGISAIDAARMAHHRPCYYAAKKWTFAVVFLDITKAYDRSTLDFSSRSFKLSSMSLRFCSVGCILGSLTEP